MVSRTRGRHHEMQSLKQQPRLLKSGQKVCLNAVVYRPLQPTMRPHKVVRWVSTGLETSVVVLDFFSQFLVIVCFDWAIRLPKSVGNSAPGRCQHCHCDAATSCWPSISVGSNNPVAKLPKNPHILFECILAPSRVGQPRALAVGNSHGKSSNFFKLQNGFGNTKGHVWLQ